MDDQRVFLTKRLLQEGLLRLLEKKELDKINVTELCAESGINRATFYRHYTCPRDILADLQKGIVTDIHALAEKDQAQENLSDWLRDTCEYFYSHRELLCVLFRYVMDDEIVHGINGLYEQQFRNIQVRRYGRQIDADSVRLATYYYAGGIYYLIRQWLQEPVDKTPAEIAALLYKVITQMDE